MHLVASTYASSGRVGHWWAFCAGGPPARVLSALLQAGEEAQRPAVLKQTIMGSCMGLFNTLLTGSPWQPGARLFGKL